MTFPRPALPALLYRGRRLWPVARLALGAALTALLLTPVSAWAQYPRRNITLVVPFAPGGTADIIARLLAEPMSSALGYQVLVENVPGSGGTVGAARIARATPDGYQLLMGNLGTQAASVGLYPKLAYDPRTDFEPIINTGGTPMIVAARKEFPAGNFREFVAYVKANAGNVSYGSGGVGAASHLTCLFLDSLMGVQPVHVPFRGSGPALNALLSGRVDYVCDQNVSLVPSIQGDLVKGLVVATSQRLPAIPDVPTSAEQGMPEFLATGWNAVFAPKGTPKEIVTKLNAAARAALKDAGVRRRLSDLGVVSPDDVAQTPEALRAFVSSEIDKWVPIIKKSGVTAPPNGNP